jgi:20S proteasome subunit beta 7
VRPVHDFGRRVEDECAEDGGAFDADEIHHYLTRIMYNRRNKFNPLWNQLIVAGKSKTGA